MNKKILKKISAGISIALFSSVLFAGSAFAEDTINPTKPGNFKIIRIASKAAELSWTDSTDNVGIKEYKVLNVTDGKTYTTTSTKYAVVGLTPDTEYLFSVYAVDTSLNASPSAQAYGTTLTDTQANATFQVSGKLTPDVSYSMSAEKALQGFTIVLSGANGYTETATTNSNGEFMLPMVKMGTSYTVSIKKDGFLERVLNYLQVLGNIELSETSSTPLSIWPGDVVIDGAINMSDIMEIYQHFNTAIGSPGYVDICDFNKDGAINSVDTYGLGNHFNTDTSSYPSNYAASAVPLKPQY
jgi:chitodextrinase